MLTIGELARAAGTTTRTVRHYHAIGLLPEPSRRDNGYREYDARALLRLVRIRRLGQLGLSLPEIRDALGDAEDVELREMLGELVADLERQERALRGQRERLIAVLARETDLAVPTALADLLAAMRRSVSDSGVDADVVAREAEMLELLAATVPPEQFAELATGYHAALADPERVERGIVAGRRFEALAAADPEDPEVAALAREFVALGEGVLGPATPPAADGAPDPGAGAAPDGSDAVWASYLATLAPAQQRCLTLVAEGVQA
jgi:DNA-binding transcriptional MerR regulator